MPPPRLPSLLFVDKFVSRIRLRPLSAANSCSQISDLHDFSAGFAYSDLVASDTGRADGSDFCERRWRPRGERNFVKNSSSACSSGWSYVWRNLYCNSEFKAGFCDRAGSSFSSLEDGCTEGSLGEACEATPGPEYVDVDSGSHGNMNGNRSTTDMVPPVLVTYAANVQWERVGKPESFSYSAQLAKANLELESDLSLTESRSDPEGRSYLHILTVDEITHILEKLRAKDVEILPVRHLCEWADHLVFATGRSDKHLRGIADALVYQVKRRSTNIASNMYPTVEGRESQKWMVVDCGSIVVHVFEEDARKYYDLEALWKGRIEGYLEGPSSNEGNPRISCGVA